MAEKQWLIFAKECQTWSRWGAFVLCLVGTQGHPNLPCLNLPRLPTPKCMNLESPASPLAPHQHVHAAHHHLPFLSLTYHSPLLFLFSLPTHPYFPHPSSDLPFFSLGPNCPHASHLFGLRDTSLSLLILLVDQLFSVPFVFQPPFLPSLRWVNSLRLCPWQSHNPNITTKQNN